MSTTASFTDEAAKTRLARIIRHAKSLGFSDRQLAVIANRGKDPQTELVTEAHIRALRKELGIQPVYKCVDTCAGEFEAYTPYYYSTYDAAPYDWANESRRTDRKKIVILGGGPNRIGQGIEFDYCCVHAVLALKELGYETIMVNSNPETVSTDYDTADKLYFEPVTAEDVLAILDLEKPDGVIVQFGGQTPLNIAAELAANGAKIIGTSPDSIALAEDRRRFGALLDELNIPQATNATGHSYGELLEKVHEIGYPVMVRPSFVLGGRAMEIVWSDTQLERFVGEAARVSPGHPILIDKFLDGAIEVDVDALSDGQRVVIAAIMEHVEEAGIHSGDSACCIPSHSLSPEVLTTIRAYTKQLGLALKVKGLMNIQYAVRNGIVYVLEVNPRASRTVPFVSKTIGIPVAKLAAQIMVGKTLEELNFTEEPQIPYFSFKEAVLPFNKFAGARIALGPEMRSTGEVMGIDFDYGIAFAKSQAGAGSPLPLEGGVFISVNEHDKPEFLEIAEQLTDFGFRLFCTRGTAQFLRKHGISSQMVYKVNEGRPNLVDYMINNSIQMVINTFTGEKSKFDESAIRANAIGRGIPLFTTVSAARAVTQGIRALKNGHPTILPIQEYHKIAREKQD